MAEQKVELRKIRDFSENLNDTILFIRQNFKPLLTCFLAIAGIFMLTSAILNGLYQSQWTGVFQDILTRRNTTPVVPDEVINGNYFLAIIFGWLNFVAMQVVIISYIKVYEAKNREAPLIEEVWNVFKAYFLKVFFYSIPIAFFTVLGLFLCLAPGIYLLVVFVPFSALLIIEDQTFSGAYNRCLALIRDNFWISLGIYFLTYLIAAFCGGIISLMLSAVTGLVSYFTTRDVNTTMIAVISVLDVFSFLFYIIYYVSVCMHYFSLTEKLDGTGMMKKLDSIGGNNLNSDTTQEQY